MSAERHESQRDDEELAGARVEWRARLQSCVGTEHGGGLVIRVTMAHAVRVPGRDGIQRHGSFLVTCRTCRTTRIVQARDVLEDSPTRCRSARCRAFSETNPVRVGGHVVGFIPHTD